MQYDSIADSVHVGLSVQDSALFSLFCLLLLLKSPWCNIVPTVVSLDCSRCVKHRRHRWCKLSTSTALTLLDNRLWSHSSHSTSHSTARVCFMSWNAKGWSVENGDTDVSEARSQAEVHRRMKTSSAEEAQRPGRFKKSGSVNQEQNAASSVS